MKTSKARIVHSVNQSLRRASADEINKVDVAPFKTVTLSGLGQRHPVVYGRDRTSGVWLVHPFVADGRLVFAIEWSYGLCKGVQDIYINEAVTPAAPDVDLTHYNGTPDQTADPTLVAAFLEIGETFTDAYENIAYTVFSISAAAGIVGDPKVSAVFDGRILYDPRTLTSAFSENPALFIYDLVTSTAYGPGLTVSGIDECADWCDSDYLGETRCLAGYTIGGKGYTLEELLGVMCTYAEAIWSYDGETVLLVPDAPATEQPAIGKGGTVSTESTLYVNTFDEPGEFRPTGPLDEFSIYLAAESGDVLLETVTPVTEPKYTIDILSDGFTPEDLFASSEAGIYMATPSPSNCFTDTAGTTPVAAVGDLVASWRSEVNGLIAIQATSANRPRYGRHPKGGVRNLLQSTEDLSTTNWTKVNGATVTGTNVINLTATSDYIQQSFGANSEVGDVFTASALFSGSGTVVIQCTRTSGETIEGSLFLIELTATPTRYSVSHTFAFAHAAVGVRIGWIGGGTATSVTCTDVQLEYGSETPYQKVADLWDVTQEGIDDCYGLYFADTTDTMAFASSTGQFNFMHDGSGGEIILSTSIGNNKNTDDSGFLAVTAGGADSNGFYIFTADASPSNKTLAVGIRNGNTGSPKEISLSSTLYVDAMVPQIFGMNYEYVTPDNTLRRYRDGVETNTGTSSTFIPNTADASGSLTIISSGLVGWVYGALCIDRILTETERAKVNQFFAIRTGADAQATLKVKYEASTIPDYWIAPWDIEDNSLKMSASGGISSPTTVVIDYLPPSGDASAWVPEPVEVSLPGVYSGDTESIESGVSMLGTYREIEATQKGVSRLNRLRFTGQYTWNGFDNAIRLKKGKVAELPTMKGITRQWVRILDVQMIKPGRHQIVAEHYDAQMYSTDVVSAYPDSPVYVGLIIPYSGTLPDGWADFTAANGKYIVGAGTTYAIGATGGSETAGPWSGTTSEDDLHDGKTSGTEFPAGQGGGGNYLSFNTNPGAITEILHAHAVDVEAFTPDVYRRHYKLMKKTGTDGETIPTNAVIFGDDFITATGLQRITEFNNRLLFADAEVGDFGQAEISLASLNAVADYTQDHQHDSVIVGESQTGVTASVYVGTRSGGAHAHPATAALDIDIKSAPLPCYGGSVAFAIKRGMIAFWDGAEVDIPTDWYLCDGTNGTEDFTDYFVKFAGDTTPVKSGDNTISFSGSIGRIGHSHANDLGESTVSAGSTYHKVITHDHTLEMEISWTPPYYALAIIQYLPAEA